MRARNWRRAWRWGCAAETAEVRGQGGVVALHVSQGCRGVREEDVIHRGLVLDEGGDEVEGDVGGLMHRVRLRLIGPRDDAGTGAGRQST